MSLAVPTQKGVCTCWLPPKECMRPTNQNAGKILIRNKRLKWNQTYFFIDPKQPEVADRIGKETPTTRTENSSVFTKTLFTFCLAGVQAHVVITIVAVEKKYLTAAVMLFAAGLG